jgi:hypothetical protein
VQRSSSAQDGLVKVQVHGLDGEIETSLERALLIDARSATDPVEFRANSRDNQAMAPVLALLASMRARTTSRLLQKLAIYLFAMVVGVLGGRITTAANWYMHHGWSAMWIEVGSWGPTASARIPGESPN